MCSTIGHVAALLTVLWIITATVAEPDAQNTALKNANLDALNKDLIADSPQESLRIIRAPCKSCTPPPNPQPPVQPIVQPPVQPTRRRSHHHKKKKPDLNKLFRPHGKKSHHKKHRHHHKSGCPHGKKGRYKQGPGPADPPHAGFAIIGDSYYKGNYVKCKPKHNIVCMDGCRIGTCDDVKKQVNYTRCQFGIASMRCNTSLVCDCDLESGYVWKNATDKKCIRESECLAEEGLAKHEMRCSYIGCNDNATCANAFNSTTNDKLLPVCTSKHELENCTEPTPHCPLMHYWNNGFCVHRGHCYECTQPHEIPVCTDPKCVEIRHCGNTWHTPPCMRDESYPNCTTPPECRCDAPNGYVRPKNSTSGNCIDRLECVQCGANEFSSCPSADCSERTYDDIEQGRVTQPCEPSHDHLYQCNERPVCHCMFPRIRHNGTCVLPAAIFTECDGDDHVTAVCLTEECSLRNCYNREPETLCTGHALSLYYCTRATISCQCIKGDWIYNEDGSTAGSRDTCNTKAECDTISEEYDDDDDDDDNDDEYT